MAFRPKVSYANNCNMTINLYRSNQRLNFNNIHKLGAIRNWPNGMVSWFLLIPEKAIIQWFLECVILVFWILYCTNILDFPLNQAVLWIAYNLWTGSIHICVSSFFNYFLIFKWFYVFNCSNRRHLTRNLYRGTLIHEKRIKQTSNHIIISRSHISFEMLII